MTVLASSSPSPPVTDDFQIGDRVLVGGVKPGIIVYIGDVHFSAGEWAGVVLDTPTGKNDGKVGGRRYFTCELMRGVFSRLGKLTKLPRGTPADAGSTTRIERNDSSHLLDSVKSGADASSLPKVANSKVSAVLPEKPTSPTQSTGSHHSSQGTPSANHSEGNDHAITRFHFLPF